MSVGCENCHFFFLSPAKWALHLCYLDNFSITLSSVIHSHYDSVSLSLRGNFYSLLKLHAADQMRHKKNLWYKKRDL